MKLHCYNDLDILAALGNSNIIQVNDELVKIKFKDACLVQDALPHLNYGNRPKMIAIDSWTKNCRSRACDIKDALFALGVTVYLIETTTAEVITTFMPKVQVATLSKLA